METYGLSKREVQVARLLLEGKSNKQIAVLLDITEGTVEYHLTSIYTKLGVGSRIEAIIRFRQSESSGNTPEKSKLGETPGEENGESGETPGEFITPNPYDKNTKISTPHDSAAIRKKSFFKRKNMIPAIIGITLVLLTGIALYSYFSVPKSWKSYQRECEYPDKNTGGQTIGRSKASGKLVHGQFGAMDVEPWPGTAGEVIYENISLPGVEQLYLRLHYSKNSSSSVPILVYLDDEKTPRASIYPQNQGDWNRFAWTDPVFLGSVESGVHTLTFSTVGQQYGIADLDRFVLSAGLP